MKTQNDSSNIQLRGRMPSWFGASCGFAGSFIIHTAAVIVLACMVFPQITTTSHILGFAVTDNGGDVDPELNSFEVGSMEAPSQSESIVDAEVAMASVTALVGKTQVPTSENIRFDTQQLVKSQPSSTTLTGLVSDAENRKMGKGRGFSDGSGTSFFGIGAKGRHFVFVVDSSRSMTGERWQAACTELMRSIQELGPDQRYYVICFDVGPRPLFDQPARRNDYIKPGAKTFPKVRNWMQSLALGPDTRPAGALEIALAMEPDAIFLLSDGELRDESMLLLQQFNRKADGKPRTVIHTISLLSAEGMLTLQQIAAQNGGDFKAIMQ